jgi:hypothetical protein
MPSDNALGAADDAPPSSDEEDQPVTARVGAGPWDHGATFVGADFDSDDSDDSDDDFDGDGAGAAVAQQDGSWLWRGMREAVASCLGLPFYSRCWVILLLLSYLLCCVVPTAKSALALHWPSVMRRGEWWRLVTSFVCPGDDMFPTVITVGMVFDSVAPLEELLRQPAPWHGGALAILSSSPSFMHCTALHAPTILERPLHLSRGRVLSQVKPTRATHGRLRS